MSMLKFLQSLECGEGRDPAFLGGVVSFLERNGFDSAESSRCRELKEWPRWSVQRRGPRLRAPCDRCCELGKGESRNSRGLVANVCRARQGGAAPSRGEGGNESASLARVESALAGLLKKPEEARHARCDIRARAPFSRKRAGQASTRVAGVALARHDPGRVPSRVLAQVQGAGSRAPRVFCALCSPDLLDALQAEVIRVKKRGIDTPFVYVDLRKWYPKWARTDSTDDVAAPEVSKDIRDLAKARFPSPASQCGSFLTLANVPGSGGREGYAE